jgi:hypothetical protein
LQGRRHVLQGPGSVKQHGPVEGSLHRPETIDALAAFEVVGEDRESDLCDEPGSDDEPSIGTDSGVYGPDVELDPFEYAD